VRSPAQLRFDAVAQAFRSFNWFHELVQSWALPIA
jgi:hypothetical protein